MPLPALPYAVAQAFQKREGSLFQEGVCDVRRLLHVHYSIPLPRHSLISTNLADVHCVPRHLRGTTRGVGVEWRKVGPLAANV